MEVVTEPSRKELTNEKKNYNTKMRRIFSISHYSRTSG